MGLMMDSPDRPAPSAIPVADSLTRLYRDAAPVLRSVAERALSALSRESALAPCDLVQRVFLRLLEGKTLNLIQGLPLDRQIQRLAAAVRYEALHAARDDELHRGLEREAMEGQWLGRRPRRPDESVPYLDLQALVEGCTSLTTAEREVCEMVLLEEWQVGELAERLSKKPGTVRELLRRGRKKLRKAAEGRGGSGGARS